MIWTRVGGAVLGAVLIPLLACPPTSIPTRHDEGGHFIASPYAGAPRVDPPPPVAPRSSPVPDTELPVWNLDASLAEVLALLETDDPPDWAPWIALALMNARGRGDHDHLIVALSSPTLSAEHLAWWRSRSPDPTYPLLAALDRSSSERTRALLTTTLALTEYAKSCPVEEDVDGACRSPGTDLLLRRHAIPLERAREWTKLARARWAKLEVDPDDVATRALLAEFELAVATADYESLLDATPPEALSFLVEDWRRNSGVPEWEAEYQRQLLRVKTSRSHLHRFYESTTDCTRSQIDVYYPLLGTDARSTGVVALRDAWMLLAFARTLDEVDRHSAAYAITKWAHVGTRQSDPLHEQAHGYLAACVELGQATLDAELLDACATMLWRTNGELPPQVEFVGTPRATSRVHHYGVVGPDAVL